MIKFLVLILFYLLLLVPISTGGETVISISFIPDGHQRTMTVANLIWLIAGYCLATTMVLSLIDRAELKIRNRRLQKELNKARAELDKIRGLVAGEKDGE